MKNVLKMVYGSQKEVKLGAVDDIAKLGNRMKAISTALNKSTAKAANKLNEFIKLQADLESAYQQADLDKEDAETDIKEAVKLIDRISKQAKELGFNPKDVKGVKEIVSYTEDIEDTINTLEAKESDIKRIISI